MAGDPANRDDWPPCGYAEVVRMCCHHRSTAERVIEAQPRTVRAAREIHGVGPYAIENLILQRVIDR